MRFYQEKETGDYLVIDETSNTYYRNMGKDYFEGRATAIGGQVSSVQTTAIDRGYLKEKCKRVKKADVPKEWLDMLI